MKTFPTSYTKIVDCIANINPIAYSQTRNYTNGAVSMLSPYISRGVISTVAIYNTLRQSYTAKQCETYLKELLWREYFQRLLQHTPITPKYPGNTTIPSALLKSATGIEALDQHIDELYKTGYLHNHVRLYLAAVCHMTGYPYYSAAQWMYYHLLDGDVASNFYSWQWVYGLITGKKYIVNQNNINRFCGSYQTDTFLDKSYEVLQKTIPIKTSFTADTLQLFTVLPEPQEITINNEYPILIYNSYNLDPEWHSTENANRILLLEPSHFKQYPVSEKVLKFILSLAKNIKDIQIYIGEYQDLTTRYTNRYIAKEHPLFNYPKAVIEPRSWLAENITERYSSYSKYFKKVKEKHDEYFT